MTDWAAMMKQAGEAGGDRAPGLKAALPLAYVLERWNYPVVAEGDELRSTCPFHDDTNPSMTVYKREGGERFKCFSCGAGGDLFDLLRRLHEGPDSVDRMGFGAVLDSAEELLAAMKAEGWKGPELGVKRPFDFEAARQYVEAAEVTSTAAVWDLLNGKPGWRALFGVDPDELASTWGLGSANGWTVIPYYRRDGTLVTYKRRQADTPALAAGGSDFSDVLYGEWLDTDTSKPVVLVEGESDAWAAWAHVGQEYAVLAIPTGAGSHPKPGQVAGLAKRNVRIAFDGDTAGREGAARWWAALEGVAANRKVVSLADGEDLAGLIDPAEAIRGAQAVLDMPPDLLVVGGVWARRGRGKAEEHDLLANWALEPQRVLAGAGDFAFEGVVHPTGDSAVLSMANLSSLKATKEWSSSRGLSFYGTERDTQLIQGYLQAVTAFMPRGRMETVAGLHRGHFVWPGGHLGPTDVTYVPPLVDVHLEQKLRIQPGDWDPALPARLRALHRQDVMDPILAWLAVAPLRALFKGGFPTLAVTGGSGSGKTTLLETVLPAFSGSRFSLNLTATTQHPLFAAIGSTNAFPLWVDEYRPGARKETKETFEQMVRDAYDGQSSAKGGMGGHWGEVKFLPALAPIVVSGEDSFAETSHVDRMIPVHLPREGKNADALMRVHERGLDSGFPHAYLSHLLQDELPESLLVRGRGPGALKERMRTNLGILHYGWRVLSDFVLPFGVDLGEPDFSRIEAQLGAEAKTEPLLEAIQWVHGEAYQEAIRDDGEWLWVVPESLIDYLSRHTGGPTLPVSKAGGLRDLLAQPPFNGESRPTRAWGTQRRAWRIDRSILGEVE